MWMNQEDGTSLLYKTDPSTGEATLYEGWYTDSTGDKYYFEKGKAVSGWIIDDGKFYYLDMKQACFQLQSRSVISMSEKTERLLSIPRHRTVPDLHTTVHA